jgi:glutathione-specific gamma-glutamylcyclotransferase
MAQGTDDFTRRPPSLTREMLLGGGFADMLARAVPGLRMTSDAERHASLHATLAARPERGGGVWVFAYGSLLWNPTVHAEERRGARVRGWHRAFCIGVTGLRGSPDNPGLVLGLHRGGTCDGAVLRLPETTLEAELDVLWRREMLGEEYVPHWLSVEDEHGHVFGQAIAFTVNPDAQGFEGDVPEAEVVRRLATAQGALGSSAEYLFRTWHGLRGLGIHDPLIERVAAKVKARLRDATEATPPRPRTP